MLALLQQLVTSDGAPDSPMVKPPVKSLGGIPNESKSKLPITGAVKQ